MSAGRSRWGGWHDVLEGSGRETLEGRVLPAYLPRQRWFGGKTRTIRCVRLFDVAALPAADEAVLAWIQVEYETTSSPDIYVLPLVAVPEGRPAIDDAPAIARGVDGRGAAIYDGTFDPHVRRALLDLIRGDTAIPTQLGEVAGHAGAAFRTLAGLDVQAIDSRLSSADQSNTSICYGARLMLKLFRRPEEGVHPEREITEFLTDQMRFPAVAPFAGSIEYRRPGREPMTIALLQAFVANEGDAWSWTMGRIGTQLDAIGAGAREPRIGRSLAGAWLHGAVSPRTAAAIGDYLDAVDLLGTRTAELHAALSARSDVPAFAPERLGPQQLDLLTSQLVAGVAGDLDALERHLDDLPEALRGDARAVLGRRPAILDAVAAVRRLDGAIVRTRVHGDYHLGQVLRTASDFVIVDFEGEPTRSLAERRAKRSPVKDVAGMLRSFCYAAESANLQEPRWDAGVIWQWQAAAGARFLNAYRRAVRNADIVPPDTERFAVLLDAFLLEKALYELRYELNNRPEWAGIPLAGLRDLVWNGKQDA